MNNKRYQRKGVVPAWDQRLSKDAEDSYGLFSRLKALWGEQHPSRGHQSQATRRNVPMARSAPLLRVTLLVPGFRCCWCAPLAGTARVRSSLLLHAYTRSLPTAWG